MLPSTKKKKNTPAVDVTRDVVSCHGYSGLYTSSVNHQQDHAAQTISEKFGKRLSFCQHLARTGVPLNDVGRVAKHANVFLGPLMTPEPNLSQGRCVDLPPSEALP